MEPCQYATFALQCLDAARCDFATAGATKPDIILDRARAYYAFIIEAVSSAEQFISDTA